MHIIIISLNRGSYILQAAINFSCATSKGEQRSEIRIWRIPAQLYTSEDSPDGVSRGQRVKIINAPR